MKYEPNDSTLVRTLKDWHEDMSPEVRMVFDHDDGYETIVELAAELTNEPANLVGAAEEQADYAKRLGELADHLDGLGERVGDWQGASRTAFDRVITDLNDRIHALHEMGNDSSLLIRTAEQGRGANDHLLSDLVRTSIDYAERSLQTARSMAPLTGGLAMSQWAAANLKQVALLLEQLADANERVNSLLSKVSLTVNELTLDTHQASDDLDKLTNRLG